MPKHKFDETDRAAVISEVEKHFGVKLSRVHNYRRFLQDSAGVPYWVLGAYEDWHGINPDMINEQARRPKGGVLVVASMRTTGIDIFSGPLAPLIANRKDLVHTQTGDYQFHVVAHGNSMTIKEVGSLVLRKLGFVEESARSKDQKSRDQKSRDQKSKDFEDALAKLSVEELSRLLEQVKRKQKA